VAEITLTQASDRLLMDASFLSSLRIDHPSAYPGLTLESLSSQYSPVLLPAATDQAKAAVVPFCQQQREIGQPGQASPGLSVSPDILMAAGRRPLA
jgi:hypothetical protein